MCSHFVIQQTLLDVKLFTLRNDAVLTKGNAYKVLLTININNACKCNNVRPA